MGYIESRTLLVGELHTNREQHTHTCSTNQESSRKKFYLLKLPEAPAVCSTVTEKDFLPFGEVELVEHQAMTQSGSVGTT